MTILFEMLFSAMPLALSLALSHPTSRCCQDYGAICRLVPNYHRAICYVVAGTFLGV